MDGDVRLQSSLGDSEQFTRKDQRMNGQLAVGRVVRVHHKNHTADVLLLKNKDLIAGSENTEGLNTCRITENYAGYDERYGVYYGDITPIQENTLVLMGFAENYKARPFIIRTIHEVDNQLNPMPDEYPLAESDEHHRYEMLRLTRLQDYFYMSGKSEFEMVHHSQAYVAARIKDIDDSRNGFNFQDLYVKNKQTGKTVGIPQNKRQSNPLDFIVSLRSNCESNAKLLQMWASAKTSSFRLSQDLNDNKLTFMEVNEAGQLRIKRQLDSNIRDNSQNYTEVSVGANGVVEITKNLGGGKATKITIGANGEISLDTQQSVKIHGDQPVSVTSNTLVSISAPQISIG